MACCVGKFLGRCWKKKESKEKKRDGNKSTNLSDLLPISSRGLPQSPMENDNPADGTPPPPTHTHEKLCIDSDHLEDPWPRSVPKFSGRVVHHPRSWCNAFVCAEENSDCSGFFFKLCVCLSASFAQSVGPAPIRILPTTPPCPEQMRGGLCKTRKET